MPFMPPHHSLPAPPCPPLCPPVPPELTVPRGCRHIPYLPPSAPPCASRTLSPPRVPPCPASFTTTCSRSAYPAARRCTSAVAASCCGATSRCAHWHRHTLWEGGHQAPVSAGVGWGWGGSTTGPGTEQEGRGGGGGAQSRSQA